MSHVRAAQLHFPSSYPGLLNDSIISYPQLVPKPALLKIVVVGEHGYHYNLTIHTFSLLNVTWLPELSRQG